jgi:DNA-binding helix-hairpin-helix protein with protein kinase domain
MFEAAFLEAGAKGARPTAGQWRSALDYLRGHLRRCSSTKMHIYPGHLTACPWCQFEGLGIVYFLALDVSVVPGAHFDIVRAWAAIDAVRPPQAPAAREHDKVAAAPAPLPAGLLEKNVLTVAGVLIAAAVVALLVVAPAFWWAYFGAGWGAWRLAQSPNARQAERQRRSAELSSAQVAYKNLLAQRATASGFQEKRQQLLAARDEWSGLAQREAKELEQLKATARARQKHLFLEGFLVEDAKIPGVGRAKKATLLSFGIETAADVEWDRVIVLRGFGHALTGEMVAWRASCERGFAFDPNRAVAPADVAAVRTTIALRRNALQAVLSTGATELQRLARDAQNRAQALDQQLVSAGQRLAQARADVARV